MITSKMTTEQALNGFGTGVDCSQAVFGELAPHLGIDRETALKIAAPFGGGMWNGETCGAVVGALMAIGLKYGQGDAPDQEAKQAMLAKAAAFRQQFAGKYGSCVCREILGYKIPEEMDKIMEENKFGNVCCHVVVDACEICAKVLNED
jgi:C_GCAxxG_C_C family probable redox protein